MNHILFDILCEEEHKSIKNGIGTLSERRLHAVLKRFYDMDESHHEQKIGSYYADIYDGNNIIEIQTRDLGKLRTKLTILLENYPVTIVYPMNHLKHLSWITPETGEVTKKRKSPRIGTFYDAISELYKLKFLLTHPNLRIDLLLIDVEEYRNLNGWSKDKKKGSSRAERIPTHLFSTMRLHQLNDWLQFIPLEFYGAVFTSKMLQKACNIRLNHAQTLLHILHHLGLIEVVEKIGNLKCYRIVQDD